MPSLKIWLNIPQYSSSTIISEITTLKYVNAQAPMQFIKSSVLKIDSKPKENGSLTKELEIII